MIISLEANEALHGVLLKDGTLIRAEDGKENVDSNGRRFINITAVKPCDVNPASVKFKSADMSGINQSGKDFSLAKLGNIRFAYAVLKGTNFQKADVQNADFHNATLSNTNFSFSKLIGANFGMAKLENVNFAGADMSKSNLQFTLACGAKFTYADLSGANMNYAKLDLASFTGANLTGADLSSAGVRRADFTGAVLQDVNLNGADLYGVTGNGREIKSLQLATLPIVYTATELWIGCLHMPIEEWWTDIGETLIKDTMKIACQEEVDLKSLWLQNKNLIRHIITKSPAKSTNN